MDSSSFVIDWLCSPAHWNMKRMLVVTVHDPAENCAARLGGSDHIRRAEQPQEGLSHRTHEITVVLEKVEGKEENCENGRHSKSYSWRCVRWTWGLLPMWCCSLFLLPEEAEGFVVVPGLVVVPGWVVVPKGRGKQRSVPLLFLFSLLFFSSVLTWCSCSRRRSR